MGGRSPTKDRPQTKRERDVYSNSTPRVTDRVSEYRLVTGHVGSEEKEAGTMELYPLTRSKNRVFHTEIVS